MKLSSCPRCERHVLVEAAACPFCGTRLGTTLALGSALGSTLGRAMMVAVVGLGMSCGGDDSGDTVAETVTVGDPTAGATSQGATTAIEQETDAGGADYAGPGDTSLSGPPPDDTTGSSTGETDTDTDTGDTTGTPGTDSGGADYAGAGPQ